MPPRRAPRAASVEALPTAPVPTSTAEAELVRDPSRPDAVTLYLDDAESSHVDLADATYLEFEYLQQMLAVLDVARPDEPLRAVHLGGGACTFARALDALRPGSTQLVVELDAELARLVREWFGLPRAPRLRIRVGDARQVLGTLTPGAWDVVIRDVFAGPEVPPHVRTLEAAQEARRALRESGLYLVNLTDRPPLRAARAEVATLRAVFPHVLLIADPAILRGRRFGNVVLAASVEPVDVTLLGRALRTLPLPVQLRHGAEVADFAGTAAPLRDPAPVPDPAALHDSGTAAAAGP
ncbi:spermidine synthase [Georgenia faecalis]|uniref:Spermidine synthase n=1 Tax=Georgenia faecalis TaxID=2483799 RepID=A0ABV9DDB2_9MICO|nr:fused MFS/spermidine synthase [Georgenia faecalis]